MKIAIVGSRSYPHRHVVRDFVRLLAEKCPGATVVSGGARGVDTWAEEAAREFGLEVEVHLPDWSRGRGAGMERNSTIVARSERLIAFWDGQSRGTLDSVRKAINLGKRVILLDEKGNQRSPAEAQPQSSTRSRV